MEVRERSYRKTKYSERQNREGDGEKTKRKGIFLPHLFFLLVLLSNEGFLIKSCFLFFPTL